MLVEIVLEESFDKKEVVIFFSFLYISIRIINVEKDLNCFLYCNGEAKLGE